ncbi:stalk domain-containing protein [Acetivibrio cellulolyticus]|uniref:stalk domain-containing protein n=1 Tax=Acetivibrio cellulolyticus TaxID=35830 RepID=UPI0001E2C275|nr:stalk domain-containing protein [Acetivibrio cellulolyticus]
MVKSWRIILVLILLYMVNTLHVYADSSNPKINYSEETMLNKTQNAILLLIGSNTGYVGNKPRLIDTVEGTAVPYITNGRTMVPLRFLAENLDAEVEWKSATSTALIKMNGRNISFQKGEKVMTINGKTVNIDAAPELLENRLFIPIGVLIRQALEREVFYKSGLIVIPGIDDHMEDPTQDTQFLDFWTTKLSKPAAVGSYELFKKLVQKIEGNKEAYSTSIESKYSVHDIGLKTANDGNYLYTLSNKRLCIVNIQSPKQLKLMLTLDYSKENLSPDIVKYCGNDRLIVIFTGKRANQDEYTRAILYSLAPDRTSAEKLREVELAGTYMDCVYDPNTFNLLTHSYIYYCKNNTEPVEIPGYKDSASSSNILKMQQDNILFFDDLQTSNCINSIVFSLNDSSLPAKAGAIYNAGENVCLTENEDMYIFKCKQIGFIYGDNALAMEYEENKTKLYKFDLTPDGLVYKAFTYISGSPLLENSVCVLNPGTKDSPIAFLTKKYETFDNKSNNVLYTFASTLKLLAAREISINGDLKSLLYLNDQLIALKYRYEWPSPIYNVENPLNPLYIGEYTPVVTNSELNKLNDTTILELDLGTPPLTFPSPDGYADYKTSSPVFRIVDLNNIVSNDSKPISLTGFHAMNYTAIPDERLIIFNGSASTNDITGFLGAKVYSLDSTGKLSFRVDIQTLKDEDLQAYLTTNDSTTMEDTKNSILLFNKFLYSMIINHVVHEGKLYSITEDVIVVTDLSTFTKESELQLPAIDIDSYIDTITSGGK